jgi:hypothetical protein
MSATCRLIHRRGTFRHRYRLEAYAVVARIGEAVVMVTFDDCRRYAIAIRERIAEGTVPNVCPKVAARCALNGSHRHGISLRADDTG